MSDAGIKVRGANMGPIWGRQDPGGPRVGPMNFATWETLVPRVGASSYIHRYWWVSLFFLHLILVCGTLLLIYKLKTQHLTITVCIALWIAIYIPSSNIAIGLLIAPTTYSFLQREIEIPSVRVKIIELIMIASIDNRMKKYEHLCHITTKGRLNIARAFVVLNVQC